MTRKQYSEDSLVVLVGKRIRQLRKERDMSLRDFGEKSRLHPFHVLAIEQGQLAANTKTLRAIAATLEVSPADLLNYDTENDLGFLSELMRKEPDMVKKIRERIEFLVVN